MGIQAGTQPAAIDALDSAKKQKCIELLLAGEHGCLTKVAQIANVSRQAVLEYKRRHLAPAVAMAAELSRARATPIENRDTREIAGNLADLTHQVAASGPILARIAHRDSERARILGQAEQDGDYRAWASLDRNDLSAAELQARLTGALSEGQTTITAIQIVVPADVQVSQRDTALGCIDVECEDITVGR